MKNLSAIDLFCGIGGLSCGIQSAGIKVNLGIDLDKNCKSTYEENIQCDFLNKSVNEITGKEILKYWDKGGIKVLVGCAPCQPFSTHSNKNKDRGRSEKWNLLNQFIRLIKEASPHVISMENVPNLKNQQIFEDFVTQLKLLKYYVNYTIVYCPDFGIAQKRKRLVLLASKYGKIDLVPKTNNPSTYITTRDAIGHLPKIDNGEICKSDPLHRSTKLNETNIKRIKASKQNGTWLDWDESLRLPCHKKESGQSYKSVYGRMAWDEPSPTITTQFYNYGTGRFGHPEQNRALSIREGAILQSFPEDYIFYSEEDEIYLTRLGVHIGNAVPVKLGVVIGESIIKHIKSHV